MNDITAARAGLVGSDTEEQSKANLLHKGCENAVRNIKQNIKILCENLSIIKDENLFRLLGSTSFNSYCETSLNIGRLQAHKYYIVGCFLRSFETVYPGKQNITDCNSFTDLGIEKMYLLASLKAGELQTIQENTDLSAVSKRELKEKISDLRALQKVKESSNFTGSIADFKKSVDVVADKYNEITSGSSNVSGLDPKLVQYYQSLLSLSALLERLCCLTDDIEDNLDIDPELAVASYVAFHPWLVKVQKELDLLDEHYFTK